MDGLSNGWLRGWMDGWMDGRTDGWMDGRMDGWKQGWRDAGMEGEKDGRTDGLRLSSTTPVYYYSLPQSEVRKARRAWDRAKRAEDNALDDLEEAREDAGFRSQAVKQKETDLKRSKAQKERAQEDFETCEDMLSLASRRL